MVIGMPSLIFSLRATIASSSLRIFNDPNPVLLLTAEKIVLILNADPGYDWIFSRKIAGLITCWGGANSHMAIRSSELNLPAAIGVGSLKFKELKNATLVKLDSNNKILKAIK